MTKYNRGSLYVLDHHDKEYFNILKKSLNANSDEDLISIVNNNGVLKLLKGYNYYTIIILFAKLNKELKSVCSANK